MPDVRDPPLDPASLSGLELIQLMLAGGFAPPPIAALMGFRLVEVADGWARFEGEPGPQHYNPLDVVHGGFALTLLDSALGCAVHTTLAPGVGYTTLETKVNMIRAMTQDTGTVSAEGRVIHVGRRTGVAEGKIVDAAGKVLAFGSSTCAVFTP